MFNIKNYGGMKLKNLKNIKNIISVILALCFIFVLFAGTFAQGHKKHETNKHGNGEFIEENVTTQEYKAVVEGVEAKDEVIGYKVNYSVTPNQVAIDNNWTYDVKFNDTEVAENTDSEPFENDIPSCYVEATRTNPSYTIHKTESSLVEGDNVIILNKATNEANNGFNGAASFEIKVTITKVTISEAVEAVTAVDEQLKIVETYVTGYKFTSGKWAGYSINFAEKVLKCKTYIRIVDGKEEIIKVDYTKEWHKLKCLEFGIYVKKTCVCNWSKSGHLFEYNKWYRHGKRVEIEKETEVGYEEGVTETENTSGSEEAGKQEIIVSNGDNDSNGSSSSSSNSSSNSSSSHSSSSSSSVNDDQGTVSENHIVNSSGGLPQTGEDSALTYVFYIIGGLFLLIGGIILFRKKVVNKYMK